MSEFNWRGIKLRAGGRALLAGLIAGVSLLSWNTSAMAGERAFSGVLDYNAFVTAAKRNEPIRIKYSPGGTGAAAMALARVPYVVVDGVCNSACAWSFIINTRACFTPRAAFGFHAAHDPGSGKRLNAATSYWLGFVRDSLRGKLGVLLTSSRLVNVSAVEMRRYYGDRVCGSKPAPRTEIAARDAQKPTTVAAVEPKAGKEPRKISASRKGEKAGANAQAVTRVAKLEVASGKARPGQSPRPRLDTGSVAAAERAALSASEVTLVAAAVAILSRELAPVVSVSERPSIWSAVSVEASGALEGAVSGGLVVGVGALPGVHIAGVVEVLHEGQATTPHAELAHPMLTLANSSEPGFARATRICWETVACTDVLEARVTSATSGATLPSGLEGQSLTEAGGLDALLVASQWAVSHVALPATI